MDERIQHHVAVTNTVADDFGLGARHPDGSPADIGQTMGCAMTFAGINQRVVCSMPRERPMMMGER